MGGNVIEGKALWLRCRFGREIGGNEPSERAEGEGRGGSTRGGDGKDDTSSALPSSDNDIRTAEE